MSEREIERVLQEEQDEMKVYRRIRKYLRKENKK